MVLELSDAGLQWLFVIVVINGLGIHQAASYPGGASEGGLGLANAPGAGREEPANVEGEEYTARRHAIS